MGKLKWKDNPRDFSQVIVWGGKCACGLSKLTWLCFLIIFLLVLEQLRVSILSVVWISLTACKAITPFISFKDLTAAGREWMGFVEWLEDPVFSCNVLTGTTPRELIAGDDIWLLARSRSATSYGHYHVCLHRNSFWNGLWRAKVCFATWCLLQEMWVSGSSPVKFYCWLDPLQGNMHKPSMGGLTVILFQELKYEYQMFVRCFAPFLVKAYCLINKNE